MIFLFLNKSNLFFRFFIQEKSLIYLLFAWLTFVRLPVCLSVCLFIRLSIYLNVCLFPPVFPPSLPKMLILPESWELRAEAWKIKNFFCSWWKTDLTYFLVRKSCKTTLPLPYPHPNIFQKTVFKYYMFLDLYCYWWENAPPPSPP